MLRSWITAAAYKYQFLQYDENLMTKELKSFLELLDKQGNSIKFEDLQAQREKVGCMQNKHLARMLVAYSFPNHCRLSTWELAYLQEMQHHILRHNHAIMQCNVCTVC
jgi:hypothetical protein